MRKLIIFQRKMKPKWRVYWIDGSTTIQEGVEPKTGAVVCRVEKVTDKDSDEDTVCVGESTCHFSAN
jgi:hypothetical protein